MPDAASQSRRRWLLLAVLAAGLLAAALAWRLWPARQAQELRWGGDASGGEPYLIESPGGEPGGFEGEIAEYLAEKVGLPARFVQRNWPNMPQDLTRGDIDIILNGY